MGDVGAKQQDKEGSDQNKLEKGRTRKKKKSGKDRIEEKRPWWENEEQGYASDLELNAEYDLDKITCEKVEQELGEYEEEESEDHDKKGEEEEEEEEAGREQEEDGSVGNDVDDDDEDDEDNQKSASKPVREEENRRSTRQRKW